MPVSSAVCPLCSQPAARGAENPYRPFCSERCRLLDLGGWLGEGYRIAGESAPNAAEDADPIAQ